MLTSSVFQALGTYKLVIIRGTDGGGGGEFVGREAQGVLAGRTFWMFEDSEDAHPCALLF